MRLIRLLKNDLAREASDWVDDELISRQQAEAICQRYDVDFHQAQNHSLGYRVLIALGLLFMGTALIILIGANWEDIPRALRMWGMIALTVSTQSFAVFRYRSNESAGVGLFLLGNVFFGASIILIAQVYHLGEHMPDGIFWWALGSLPFALITRSVWLMLFSLVLALIWFFVEAHMGFNPSAFPVFLVAACFVLVVSRQSILLLLSTVFALFVYIQYQFTQYWSHHFSLDIWAANAFVSANLFLATYALSHRLRMSAAVKAQDYAAVLSIWVLRFALLGLLIMSFETPWRELAEEMNPSHTSLLYVLCALMALGVMLALNTARLRLVLLLNMGLIGLAAVLMFYSVPDLATVLQVLSNIALVVTGIVLIMRGIQRGISHYFFLGVLSLLLTALLRYADLIGDYLGGALLFLFFSALLLGSAKYWKSQQIAQESTDEN
ncbi:conserved hypothetical protein [gamma proteobacterium HTCC5015]|nr:conserved hypothetical protein [gamma proteobacterium HTCC5015]